MRKSRALLCAVASAMPGAVVFSGNAAFSQFATFEVDPAVSALTVSGTAFGAPIQQQGPGSLTTTYHGPLRVRLSPDAIHFPGGSTAIANNSGNWQPGPGGVAGSAPANYGGRVTVLFISSLAAVREAVFDVTTPEPFELTSSGTFSSDLTFTATAGVVDYQSPLVGSGASPLEGDSAVNAAPNPGTLSLTPAPNGFADAALALPVRFTIITDLNGVGEGVFNFTGSMTARASARGGDANFDGVVNLADFNVLAANFGASDRNWLSGDFNFDGLVNLQDFNILAGNFGMSAPGPGVTDDDWSALASAIPEPALCGVAGLIGVLSLRRQRCNSNKKAHG